MSHLIPAPKQAALALVRDAGALESNGELKRALAKYREARVLVPELHTLQQRITAVMTALREAEAGTDGSESEEEKEAAEERPQHAALEDAWSSGNEAAGEDDTFLDTGFEDAPHDEDDGEEHDAEAELGRKLWKLQVQDFAEVETESQGLDMLNREMKRVLVEQILRIVNGGSAEDLRQLRGIGPVRAERILQERKLEPFRQLAELDRVGVPAWQAARIERDNIQQLLEWA